MRLSVFFGLLLFSSVLLAARASDIKVGVVTSFPNGSSAFHCVSTQAGTSAEDIVKKTGFETVWADFGFGHVLAKVEDVGCSESNAFCYSQCGLFWHFMLLNSSGQWVFSNAGYSVYYPRDGEVIGNLWTSGRASLPSTDFTRVCANNNTWNHYPSNTDAYYCAADLAGLSLNHSPLNGGETAGFNLTVVNKGASAASSFLTRFYVDGVLVGDKTIASLNGFYSTSLLSFNWRAVAGKHDLLFTIDALKQVTEEFEDNNDYRENIRVGVKWSYANFTVV